jgi:hypothetical protein
MKEPSQDPGQAAAPSPAAAAPTAAAPPRGTPVWARLLILAAFGCAGFLLLCFALVCVGVWWVLSPPRQLPTGALIAPTSIGVVRTGELRLDPGLLEALAVLNEEIVALEEERARRETPEWLRRFQGEQRGVPLGVMKMVVPEEATIVIERLPEGGLGWALGINFPWLVRPFQWALSADEHPRRSRHSVDGVEVREFQGGAVGAFLGGTYVLTSDLATMRVVVPRLKAAREGEGEVRLPPELPRVHEGWDLVGLLSDVRGDRAALLEFVDGVRARRTAERVLAADLSGLDLGVDLETADRLRARLEIEPVDELSIEDWAADLEALLEEWRALAEAKGLRLESRVDLQRDRIRVELSLEGVEQWLADLVRNKGW